MTIDLTLDWQTIFIMVGVVFAVAGFYFGVKRDIKELRALLHAFIDTTNKRFDDTNRRIDDTNQRFDDFGRRLDDTNALVRAFLTSSDKSNGAPEDPSSVDQNSPLGLSEIGEQMVKDTNADALVEKYAGGLDVTRDMGPYRIQEACRHYVLIELLNKVTHEERRTIEDVAFRAGEPVNTVLVAIGVKLRDHKFKLLDIDLADYKNPHIKPAA